jgi:protocatechuate 3,4-dioxygenase beta subunit
MKNKFGASRRNFMRSSLALGALVAAEWMKPSHALSTCVPTPRETAGPFYPVRYPIDKDNDLTFLNNQTGKAEGETILINGLVQNKSCEPVAGALVEIWQACSTGKYNHPRDPNKARLDPNFQYWGKALTNEKGEYAFKTIKPGSYPASWLWTRPPHIHFTIQAKQYAPLTTQMYFAGERLNVKDRLLQEHSKAEQQQCIVAFRKVKNEKIGQFNIVLI